MAFRIHRPLVRIVVFALAFRAFSAALAFFVNVVFPLWQREQFTVFGRTNLFWDTFARYDSGWYFGIAKNGYAFVEGGRSNLAFFPLYPLLMRYLGQLLGGTQPDYYIAGVVVSWTAFTLAMVMLFKLARLDLGDDERAERAAFYTAIYPFAFFYGLVYSESLYLLGAVTAFYGFRTRRWWLAGLGGATATATRVVGVMAMPAWAYEAWRSREAAPAFRPFGVPALALVAAFGGFAAYCAYVYSLSGSFVEWMNSIRRWDYNPGGAPWGPLPAILQAVVTRPYQYLATERMAPYDALNALHALAFAVSIPFVWRLLGAGYGLFMLANLWLPLSTGSAVGLARYCSVLFPFFILLARVRSPSAHHAITAVFATLYALGLALFTTLHPVF